MIDFKDIYIVNSNISISNSFKNGVNNRYFKELNAMKLKTRSILQELNSIAEVRNKEELMESRAINIINSAINLIESIRNHYDEETAGELERRFINSIKGADSAKFSRGIRKLVEARKTNKHLDETNNNED